MSVQIDDLNRAWRRAKLDRTSITFLQATTDPMWLKFLTRIAECASKDTAPGKPAPVQLDRYGERNGE